MRSRVDCHMGESSPTVLWLRSFAGFARSLEERRSKMETYKSDMHSFLYTDNIATVIRGDSMEESGS